MGGIVIGAEIVVGYVFAWVARKARRVGARADEQVDATLDAGVDQAGEKLHELVVGKLKGDPALERLVAEAEQGASTPLPRTAQRVALALEDAGEQDPKFAAAVDALAEQLRATQSGAGAASAPGGVALLGPQQIHADNGSIAAAVIHGGAQVGPQVPGPQQH
jgi:hypothetical protein